MVTKSSAEPNDKGPAFFNRQIVGKETDGKSVDSVENETLKNKLKAGHGGSDL
jgi:hypothetical protein